jgi:hypothetical protein
VLRVAISKAEGSIRDSRLEEGAKNETKLVNKNEYHPMTNAGYWPK